MMSLVTHDVTKCQATHDVLLLLQWSLDLTKCQGTGEIGSLYRGFVISRFFSTHYPITGLKVSFVIPRNSLHRGSLNRGSTAFLSNQIISCIHNIIKYMQVHAPMSAYMQNRIFLLGLHSHRL